MSISLSQKEKGIYQEEAELIRALQEADASAQGYFYRKYFGKMFGIAFRYASNRESAYEIINTAFLKVFNNISNYREMGSFYGWVATIVKRTAQDYCKQYDFGKKDFASINPPLPTTYNLAISQLAIEDIFRLVQQLPPASRTVFNLFVIDGYTHAEIAQLLNISPGTSKWHLANARKILIDLMNNQK